MRQMWPWETQYLALLNEAKHRAFDEWHKSGYKAEKAYSEWMRLYVKTGKLLRGERDAKVTDNDEGDILE